MSLRVGALMSTLGSSFTTVLVPKSLFIFIIILISKMQEPQFEVYRKIKLLGEGAFGKAFLV